MTGSHGPCCSVADGLNADDSLGLLFPVLMQFLVVVVVVLMFAFPSAFVCFCEAPVCVCVLFCLLGSAREMPSLNDLLDDDVCVRHLVGPPTPYPSLCRIWGVTL